jgi:hypothetical protein
MEYFDVFLKNLEYLRKGNFCIVNQQNEKNIFVFIKELLYISNRYLYVTLTIHEQHSHYYFN